MGNVFVVVWGIQMRAPDTNLYILILENKIIRAA